MNIYLSRLRSVRFLFDWKTKTQVCDARRSKKKKYRKIIITARGMEIDESRAIINKHKKSRCSKSNDEENFG